MKIKQEHFEHMLVAIRACADTIPAIRASIVAEGKFKDLEARLRWELLYVNISSRWICETIYPYANDDHIDTALRQIMQRIDVK